MSPFGKHWRGVLAWAGLLLLAAGAVWRGGQLVRYYQDSGTAAVPQVERAIRRVLLADGSPAAAGEAPSPRGFLRQLRRELPAGAVERLEVHRFDPQAPVFVTAGPDGQPGQAGFDDDQDGTLDNTSELGAVFSDDQTLAPTDPGYAAARDASRSRDAPAVRVISRGAYVPVGDSETIAPGDRLRVVLHGTDDGRPWVWPVEPPP